MAFPVIGIHYEGNKLIEKNITHLFTVKYTYIYINNTNYMTHIFTFIYVIIDCIYL